jgi:hypothetical protein
MAIRRVPDVSDRENFRLEPVPSLRMTTIRRDPVEPVPVGTYVAMVFRVAGYDRDCDGSLLARVENVDAEGKTTGWEQNCLGLSPESTWVVDEPGELDG